MKIHFNPQLLYYFGFAVIIIIAWGLYSLKSFKAIAAIWYKYIIVLVLGLAFLAFILFPVIQGLLIICFMLFLAILFRLPGIRETFEKLIKKKSS